MTQSARALLVACALSPWAFVACGARSSLELGHAQRIVNGSAGASVNAVAGAAGAGVGGANGSAGFGAIGGTGAGGSGGASSAGAAGAGTGGLGTGGLGSAGDSAGGVAGSACSDQCIPNTSSCVAGELVTCAIAADGCFALSAPSPCPDHASCAATASNPACVCESGYALASGQCVLLAAPRLLSPLSTATVTSHSPNLSWKLADGEDGAEIDVCADRECKTIQLTFGAPGEMARLPSPLAPGVHYWRARGTLGTVIGTSTSPVWELFVGKLSTPLNRSWGTVPDVNGDGFADLILGAPNYNSLAGGFQVYLGSAQGVVPMATSVLSPGGSFFELGSSVASAGDVNGDGFADAIIGSPGASGLAGSAYVYLGGATGLAATPTQLTSPSTGSGFGGSVTSAGDVNGDGYADVAIGPGSLYTGNVYLYLGSAAGIATTPSLNVPGGAVAGAGDVNGDGFGDLLVGHYNEGTRIAGAAYLYLGSAQGLVTPPITVTNPLGQYGFFGYSVASAGDVDGDGYADVIIGAPGINASNGYYEGNAYVFLGRTSGLAATPIPITNPFTDTAASLGTPATIFGCSVSGAGDVNGDGYADVIAGASRNSQAWFFTGSPSGISSTATPLANPAVASGLGSALSSASDVNGDGFADIIAGTPFANSAQGGAYVYLGSNQGPAASPTVLTSTWARGGLGYSVQ